MEGERFEERHRGGVHDVWILAWRDYAKVFGKVMKENFMEEPATQCKSLKNKLS